jgi:hypothetical protein
MTDQHQHRATPEQWAKVKGYAPGLEVCSCLIELRDRIQLLEATQHAHIEAKAAEAGARCAVEQLRSKPGSWQPIKTETTYGSDATTPELSEHCAPVEPEQQDKLDRLIEFGIGGWGGRASAEIDRVLALQDQIRDGALTLADALKEIGASEPAKDPFRRPSLADTLADTHHCSFFNTSVLIRAFKDWLTQEGKAPLAMRELLEAQAQIAESDPHA